MSLFGETVRRLKHFGGRSRFEAELDDEAQFHLETRADELAAAGMNRRDALAQARREFGPGTRMREETRSAWRFGWIEDLFSDLRYAARALGRNPAFAATAIGCLALGIGANTSIFSLANEVLFSQPSVRDPERLIHIRMGGASHAAIPVFRFVRDAGIFEGVGGENEESEINWRHGDAVDRVFAVLATDTFFEATGFPLALGRPIQRGETDTVVLSHGFWQRRLGGDPNVLGAKMILDGKPYTVAGVLPYDHRTVTGFGFSPDLYVPVAGEKAIVALYARMPQGMTREIAMSRLKALAQEYDRIYPNTHQQNQDIEVSAVGGIERLHSEKLMSIAAFFGMLMAVVGLVLLIACANVASLLMARASSRQHELAVRASIGAGRGRLVRQLLAESLLLALCGTAAGVGINLFVTSLLSRIRLPLPLPIQFLIQPDWSLLAYSTGVALVCCLAAGLMPAWKGARSALHSSLQHDQRTVGSGIWTLRNVLVVGQLAVSIVLLSAGFLFVRNLVQASTNSPGFDIRHTVWGHMRLVPEMYTKPERVQAMVADAIERLRGLPGVETAAIARVIPFNDNMTRGANATTDLDRKARHIQFSLNFVGPDYFHTMGIPILRGREFLPSDRKGGPAVGIINETMARRMFDGADPIGHTLQFDEGPVQIIGMAKDSKYFTLGEAQRSAYYGPYAQHGNERWTTLDFVVRAQGNPEALTPFVHATLGRLDSSAALETKPMARAMTFALLPSRVGAAVLGSMGLLGLALASVGLYGALLFAVSRRTREIGLRMALGASAQGVLGLVLRQSAGLAGIGIAIGMTLSVFAVRPLAMFLAPEIRTGDPGNFVMVGLVLGVVALLATAAPAIRALRVDPVVALRHE